MKKSDIGKESDIYIYIYIEREREREKERDLSYRQNQRLLMTVSFSPMR